MTEFKNLFVISRHHTFEENFKNYLRILFFWCPVVSALFIFGFGGFDQLPLRFAISMTIATTVASFCFFGSWIFNFLYNLYRFKRGWALKKSGLFWGVLTSYPFLLPGLYVGFNIASQVSSLFGHTMATPRFTDYSSGIIFGLMVSGIFTLFEVVRESKEQKQADELKYQALENEKLKAQISALTAQMNPHLLFNSLNTIASTITTDPTSAEDMVVKLSELYRGILKSAKGDMHSLENELLLCRSYLEIEKKRFGARVEYKIEVEETINIQKVTVPVLLLQPLVENAIKHGISPKREGGRIVIEIKKVDEYFMLNVIDNGVGIDLQKPSAGTGTALSNCESRIKLKYGKDSKFSFQRNEKEETLASILLPLKAAIGD